MQQLKRKREREPHTGERGREREREREHGCVCSRVRKKKEREKERRLYWGIEQVKVCVCVCVCVCVNEKEKERLHNTVARAVAHTDAHLKTRRHENVILKEKKQSTFCYFFLIYILSIGYFSHFLIPVPFFLLCLWFIKEVTVDTTRSNTT